MLEVTPPCANGKEVIYVMMAEDNVIRYVGRSNSPGARFVWHVSMSKKLARKGRKILSGERGYGLTDWIAELLEQNRLPKMFIVSEVCTSQADLIERELIEELVQQGVPLLNDGRNYGPPHITRKIRSPGQNAVTA